MTEASPANVGRRIHTAVRLGLIVLALALFGVTVYAIVMVHKASFGILFAGVIISILADFYGIVLYNAKSKLIAVTIAADLLAIVFCGVGATVVAFSDFHNAGEGPQPYEAHPDTKSDTASDLTMDLALVLVGFRTASVIGTIVLACVMVRRWKSEDDE